MTGLSGKPNSQQRAFAGVSAVFSAVLICGTLFCETLSAVTLGSRSSLPFQHELEVFRSSLNLPVSAKVEQLTMSDRTIKIRAKKAKHKVAIEPLQVIMGGKEEDVTLMANRLARPGKVNELASFLIQALRTATPLKPGSNSLVVSIDQAGYELVEPAAFASMYARTHHSVLLDGQALKSEKTLKDKLMDQLKPYFALRDRNKIMELIHKGTAIAVDKFLLPEFARSMVKRYIVYRGPNCFHAALAFQSPLYTRSSLVNIKEEEGYHRAMINYDELWRAINSNFYEVDPARMPLKYGDMLVFFDVPNTLPASIDYRWIRHASTYLFSGYTFSKGSKSPNTPYAVRTLAEEWTTWQKYSKKLGVKVYRRSSTAVTEPISRNLSDWVY